MEKLYRVKYEVISQAERMRDKFYFLSEQEMWKVQDSENMTNEEGEKHFKKSEEYYEKAEKISNALMSIKGYNQATWSNIIILKESALQRDKLDDEINFTRKGF